MSLLNPSNPMPVGTSPQEVNYPDDDSSIKNFDHAIQILWTDVVKKSAFHLCVGTEGGNWDIFNENVGKMRQHLCDMSGLPVSAREVYLQLITIGSGISDTDESTAGKVITITR